jgi:RNA polymerase sigma factor (sigma-70 family)
MENLIVQKVIAGKVSEFLYFIDTYKDMAFTIAYRITNNREDAEEIVQDSFLKAYKSLDKFKMESKFSTWYYKIVVNSSLSAVRARKNFISGTEIFHDTEIGEVDLAYQKLEQSDQKRYINMALDRLGDEDRLLLTLYYLNENTIDEVATITGLKKENIKMKIHRARNKMYRELAKIIDLKTNKLL